MLTAELNLKQSIIFLERKVSGIIVKMLAGVKKCDTFSSRE